MFDLAQLAVVIGVANGFILLVKPIARLHVRIDRNEQNLVHLQSDITELMSRLENHDHN